MAVITALAVLPASSQSSLFLRRLPFALSAKASCYPSPRACSASRSAAIFSPIPRSSLPRPWTRLAAAEPDEAKIEVEVEIDGGGGADGSDRGSDDGAGGGNGKSGGGDSEESEEGGADKEKGEKPSGMLMSQKITLAYAALVGVGGIMGYVKGGSQKSLAAGGISALLLYFVYTQLPVRPAFASSLGLGLSAALLVVMGSRFRRSGKIFPAGVVSLISLVMVAGYSHGILRSSHI
ncbi:protein FATTY ACID EXPORT 2, chloroplastic-like [Zingiber officinale]|uniref:Uncharacterized protein n=1 Tax=Zingiber officinale TaxID=94328 RepID=A0A8J5KYI8_ZINOF|nr:protein FATTY ACID EXPORT 2, chloroplastic-like [Zingiber officinale]KAG6494419.1 hypothetical protein ZIOFF_049444 [Zingiber officinale]